MINVLINGCNGKMGQVLLNQIQSNENFNYIGGCDAEIDIHSVQGIPDVIIDFSTPEATLSMLQYAEEKHIPVVIATTGFNDNQLEK